MSYKLIQIRLPFALHWSRIATCPTSNILVPHHTPQKLQFNNSQCYYHHVSTSQPLIPPTASSIRLNITSTRRSNQKVTFASLETKHDNRRFIAPIESFQKDNDPLSQDISHVLHKTDLGSMTPKQITHAKSIVYTLSNLRTFQAAQIAEEILERLIAEGADGGNSHVKLEAKLYNTIIDAYGKSGTDNGVDRAEALVERMRERSRVFVDLDTNEGVEFMTGPDLFTYNSLLNAWSRSKREDAVTKAEKIVDFLESNSSETVKPNSITYNIMMNTYANQVGEYGYAQKAEDLLLHMTSLQKDGYEAIHPDTTSFNIVLKAWKNSGGGVESAKRAEEILRLMVKLYVDGHDDLKPDNVSFRTVIHAYMKHGENGKLSSDIVDRIQDIGDLVTNGEIDFSDNPHIISEVTGEVLKCLAKSGVADAGKRAKSVFEKLNQSRGTTISEGLNATNHENAYVSTVIALLSDQKTADLGHEMMHDILEGKSSILPRTYTLNRILHFYCQNQNFPAAQDTYRAMLRLSKKQGFETVPDIATYNMMANLCFQTNDEDSSFLALSILNEMEEDYKSGLLSKMSDFVYDMVIHKLTKSKLLISQGNAHDVLMRMIKGYDSGALEREPGTILFNMVLSSIMNQPVESKAEKAFVSFIIIDRDEKY
jgi:PPR repeat.